MKENIPESWDGVGSKDHLVYNSGFTYDREVVNWQEGVGYDLKVTENGKRVCSSFWRITPKDDTSCTLRITGEVKFI